MHKLINTRLKYLLSEIKYISKLKSFFLYFSYNLLILLALFILLTGLFFKESTIRLFE